MTTIDPQTVPDALAERDLEQIQALVFRGFRDFAYAALLFVRLPREYAADGAPDTRRAKAWMNAVRADIAWFKGATADALPVDGERGKIPGRLAVAFTTRGLRTLGLDRQAIKLFPYEAKAGMERRARVLGDPISVEEAKKELVANPDDLDLLEADKPMPTDWSLDLRDCDALLMLYGQSEDDIAAIEAAQRKRVKDHGGMIIATEWSSQWKEREPFGFADGLSQPVLKGQPARTGVPPSPNNEIAAGEVVLGYRNEYGHVPKSPVLDPGKHPQYPDGLDIGKNGTFLVFRKLEQDVQGFWSTFRSLAADWQGVAGVPSGIEEATQWLAARAMGRWTNGNPVALCPHAPGDPLELTEVNEFTYGDDVDGNKCPIASHVRRANPRDERGGGANESWKVVKRHRILRRGRAYAGDTTGLLFVCLQSNITHGFEFVQQIWNNNPGFHGIYQEPDPIMGPGGSTFTIPAKPARLRTPPLPRFVIPRAGGYFFVPSRAVVDLLAS